MKPLLVASILSMAATSAFSASAKIDFTTPIVVNGQPLIDDFKCPVSKDGKRSCETAATIGELAYFALERPTQGQNWADAIKRDDLARAIREAKDFPLLADQRTMIEDAMGPLWSPAILGAVKSIIDPEGSNKK